MIQIRHVPDVIHKRLKEKASTESMSLSEFLLREVSQIAMNASVHEMIENLRKKAPLRMTKSGATLVREERER
jgi:antitoxin FitA